LKNIKRRGVLAFAALILAGCSNGPKDGVFMNLDPSMPPTRATEAAEEALAQTAEPEPTPAIEEAPITFDFYMTPPPLDFAPLPEVPVVHGIYVTSNRAGGDQYMQDILDVCKEGGVNAMVIDVKTEEGLMTFKGFEMADELGISVGNIEDVSALMDILELNGIYPIARLVAFKDNNSYHFKPELYIHNQDGSIWLDPQRNAWLNPYNKEACEYVLSFAKAAAEAGFKEIQFDYVRFAASSRLDSADMGDTGGKSRSEAIEDFARLAMDVLRPYGVKVSADVYGTIINSDIDAAIVGQNYTELGKIVDVLCPMVYPSHYANGSMGLDIPDLLPYDTIYESMELSNERLNKIPEGEHRAKVRPWLQDFTASWLSRHLQYGGDERGAQIQGALDAGVDEWLLWDPGVRYDAAGMSGSPALARKNTPSEEKELASLEE
jgi:hypothetical protein